MAEKKLGESSAPQAAQAPSAVPKKTEQKKETKSDSMSSHKKFDKFKKAGA